MPLFNMKNWIVSIVVNLFFISVMSMIMPKGKMATAFKSVTSLLVIIIIIQPIFELKKIDFNFGNIFNYEMDLQTNYLSYVQKTTIENYEKQGKKIVEDCGISCADVNFVYELDSYFQIKIIKIQINLKNSVINENEERINIIKKTKVAIKNFFQIDEEKIEINE